MTGGTSSFRIESLRSHCGYKDHVKCQDVFRHREEGVVEKGQTDSVTQKLGEENKGILVKLFNTVYYILEEEMPYTSLPK